MENNIVAITMAISVELVRYLCARWRISPLSNAQHTGAANLFSSLWAVRAFLTVFTDRWLSLSNTTNTRIKYYKSIKYTCSNNTKCSACHASDPCPYIIWTCFWVCVKCPRLSNSSGYFFTVQPCRYSQARLLWLIQFVVSREFKLARAKGQQASQYWHTHEFARGVELSTFVCRVRLKNRLNSNK